MRKKQTTSPRYILPTPRERIPSLLPQKVAPFRSITPATALPKSKSKSKLNPNPQQTRAFKHLIVHACIHIIFLEDGLVHCASHQVKVSHNNTSICPQAKVSCFGCDNVCPDCARRLFDLSKGALREEDGGHVR